MFPLYKTTLNLLPLKKYQHNKLCEEFKKFLPNHTLKDLRHTFTTRARECGIDNELVAVWTGHSLGNITSSVYTHIPIFRWNFSKNKRKNLCIKLMKKGLSFPQIFPKKSILG